MTEAEKTKAVLSTPGLIDKVFNHIANGGDLIDFAKSRDITYTDLANWVRSIPENLKVYSTACQFGEEWIKARLLLELKRVSLSDIRLLYNSNGTLKPPTEWPDAAVSALAGVETEDLFEGHGRERTHAGYTNKIKLYDKLKAIELIGRELGMFTQHHEVKGKLTLEELVGDSYSQPKDQSSTSTT